MIASTRAQVVDEMGKTLLKCLDRGVFVVGPSWTFEKAEQQHTSASLLTDPQADGAQHNTQCCLAFALPLAVVDVQLSMTSFAAVGRGDDANTSGHGPGSYRWSLQRLPGFFR